MKPRKKKPRDETAIEFYSTKWRENASRREISDLSNDEGALAMAAREKRSLFELETIFGKTPGVILRNVSKLVQRGYVEGAIASSYEKEIRVYRQQQRRLANERLRKEIKGYHGLRSSSRYL